MNQLVATAASRPLSTSPRHAFAARERVPGQSKPAVSTAVPQSTVRVKQFVTVLLRSLAAWSV